MSDTVASERAKYKRMWSYPDYRVISPGLDTARVALKELGVTSGQSLRDYGCGIPVAVDWFRERGILANGLDIVAQRDDVIEACLWELPSQLKPTDYAFCCDVLEHLPTEYIGKTISDIKSLTLIRGFFTVATISDNLGSMFGEKTHLTVQPVSWWIGRFSEYWGASLRHQQGDRKWRHIIVADI